MPVEFLSDEQATCYGRYHADPSPEQLARFFYLSPTDWAAVVETLAAQLHVAPTVLADYGKRVSIWYEHQPGGWPTWATPPSRPRRRFGSPVALRAGHHQHGAPQRFI